MSKGSAALHHCRLSFAGQERIGVPAALTSPADTCLVIADCGKKGTFRRAVKLNGSTTRIALDEKDLGESR